jgi:hypothetical protein
MDFIIRNYPTLTLKKWSQKGEAKKIWGELFLFKDEN